MAKITIPTSVTIIEREAFKECSSLKYINIPSFITSFQDHAFENCFIFDKERYSFICR